MFFCDCSLYFFYSREFYLVTNVNYPGAKKKATGDLLFIHISNYRPATQSKNGGT